MRSFRWIASFPQTGSAGDLFTCGAQGACDFARREKPHHLHIGRDPSHNPPFRNANSYDAIWRQKIRHSIGMKKKKVEQFADLAGIRARNSVGLDALLRFENAHGESFGWMTLRTVYPMQLVMSDGNLVVRITTSQTIEHYTRNLIVIVVLLAVSAVLFPFVNNGRGFVIALAVCLPIMTCMLFAFQYLDTPYRNEKRLQKYIDKKKESKRHGDDSPRA